MTNRIIIDNDYDVEYDGERCYTLLQKKTITGEGRGSHLVKAASIGKVREVTLGYYSTLEHALVAYMDKAVGNRSADVTAVLSAIEDCKKSICSILQSQKTPKI